MRLTLSFLLSLFVITGCSNTEKNTIPDLAPMELYATAQRFINAGNLNRAIETLEALDARYPFGPHATQVQLDLIYVYYKNNDTAQALANIDRFIRLKPTHADSDYVYYMRGLANMAADQNMFHSMFGIDRSDRDPTFARKAFQDFNRLLNRHPNSQYAADAQARMLALKHRLAHYELAVATFYIKREAWIAAANRGKYILEHFPDTPAKRPALEVMITAYEALGQTALKQHAEQVLAANPN